MTRPVGRQTDKGLRRYILFLITALFGLGLTEAYAGALVTMADSLDVDTARVHLSGRVTDDSGEGLPLATVRIEGRVDGTVTSLQGNYSLSFATADTVTVVYTMMGYETKRKTLTRPRGRLVWNVSLHSSGRSMDELTVTEVRRPMGSTQEITTQASAVNLWQCR